MATTFAEIFETMQKIGSTPAKPLPAPVVTVEKAEIDESGWYLYEVVGGDRRRMLGAYNRYSGTVSVFSAYATWGTLDGRHKESDAQALILSA